VKYGMLKSMPQADIVWPWDFLIVIENTNLIGNWKRLNSVGMSVRIIGIFGTFIFIYSNTFSPQYLPFKIVASLMFFINFLTTNRTECHWIAVKNSNFVLNLKLEMVQWHAWRIQWVQKICYIIYSFIGISNCIYWFLWY
jgi:hypothetical protein